MTSVPLPLCVLCVLCALCVLAVLPDQKTARAQWTPGRHRSANCVPLEATGSRSRRPDPRAFWTPEPGGTTMFRFTLLPLYPPPLRPAHAVDDYSEGSFVCTTVCGVSSYEVRDNTKPTMEAASKPTDTPSTAPLLMRALCRT